MTGVYVIQSLGKLADPAKARILQGFFKTGKGQYGEGDVFWGITVPRIRSIVRQHRDIPLKDIPSLLKHHVHEVRLAGVLLMVEKYQDDPEKVFNLYLKHAKFVNNWDLVDLSADKIVGRHLENHNKQLLHKLARSRNLWERRVSIVSTFYEIKKGRPETTFKIAEMLLKDEHDLIHKATGWMLREAAKRCSQDDAEEFLRKHAAHMPRTMLRYAIERFPPKKRAYYMKFK